MNDAVEVMNPLSTLAAELLQGVRLLTGHLEAQGSIGRERQGYGLGVHDIRRTVASNLAALGVRTDVVSEVLAHSVGGVTSVYERYSYPPEKRAALERWAEHLYRLAVEASDFSVR